jgi:asparagine synthase (glutamine-hydrolysing)
VPIGSFLSGGLDSATITALMAQQGDHFAVAHSVSFQNGADEGTDAAALAAQLSVPQKTNWVRPPDHSKMRALAAMFGEPFADASALGMAQLCAAAVGDMRVALTGNGADEAFAGYRRHRFHLVEEGVRGRMPKGLRAPLFGALAALYPQVDSAPQWLRARATLQALATDSASAYAHAVAMLGQEHRQHLFSSQFHAALQGYRAEEGFCAIMLNAPAQTMLDRIQYADLKFSLPGGILTKVDRTSMAVGLEVRSPFLDNDIIDFALQLPDDLRLRRGQGKWVLKAATQSLLPNATRQRPKQGFAPPPRCLVSWANG